MMKLAARVAAGAVLGLAVAAFGATTVTWAEASARPQPAEKVMALPATFSGTLVVRFHGDAATGCAARGLCGYTGTVQWTPATSWQLQTGSPVYAGYSFSLQSQGELDLGESPYDGGVTDADTEQELSGVSPPGSKCADAGLTGGEIDLPLEQREVVFSLVAAYSSIVQTRCAGPLLTDLAAALPEATVPLRAALRGDMTIDLRGDRSFAANGFAGTVDSTLMLRLGKPYVSGKVTPPSSSPRQRVVTTRYDVAISGSSVDHIQADGSDALCGPLGACGLAGTVSLRPAVGGAGASFAAYGPQRLPYRDFLAALRLGRARRVPDSISVDGTVVWHQEVATADLSRDGSLCTDSVQIGRGGLTIYEHKLGLHAYYYFGSSISGDSFRTRCPGPFGAAEQPLFASGTIPSSALAKRRFVLRLKGSQLVLDDGYTEHVRSQLALTFTRTSVSSSTT